MRMANNRIYLRCRGCGNVLFLGKSYLDGFYYPCNTDVSLERQLNDFYEEHNYCAQPKVPEEHSFYDIEAFPMPDDCGGCDGSFDIVYENTTGTGYEEK